ncbi:hypothetical protein E1B28_005297 [Marasmius oreades]|uniref:F-box domain-containing protein n=1 Tax=Marasmius oreades TaxID=181124 RepID=A0A9P7V0B8_9AGAR|nr:uncharacterized protein E1B28_005297 [Marasmius oreades]KAG7097989.1 hypothetical protein E1B28_005297 [Marasmius oreades]
MYKDIHRWQVLRNFDPNTTDFARYLGHSMIYEVVQPEPGRFEELDKEDEDELSLESLFYDAEPDTKVATPQDDKRCSLEDDYAKFNRIPQILEDWRMERVCAMERIRLRGAVLSPIRRVPVELWREIFSLFCFSGDQYPISLYSDVMGTTGYYKYKIEKYIGVNARPYTLLSVCTHWHSIVTGIPNLWSSIRIAGHFTLDLSPALDYLLSKSGNSPLTIHISSTYPLQHLHPDNRDNAIQSIKFLAAHALPRCKRFILDRSCCEFMSWERICLSFPALESLETGIPYLSLLEAPVLNHLKISHIHDPPNAIRFPLARLVSLEITNDINLQPLVLQILPLCSALQSLSAPFRLADNPYMNSIAFPDSPKEISSLQNLQIQIMDFRQDLTFLFKYFELPNLSSLEIEVSDSSSSVFIPPVTLARGSDFPTAFYRSVLGLRTLKLLFQDIQYHKSSLGHIADLSGVLTAMPSLTFLEARQQGLSNPQPNRLAALLIPLIVSPHSTMGTIVPKLATLSISYNALLCFNCIPTSEVAVFKRNILAMAESRAQHTQLTELHLGYPGFDTICERHCYDSGISRVFKELEEGMKALGKYGLKFVGRKLELLWK